MENEIRCYEKLKSEIRKFEDWVKLIGDKYNGGGGGTGHIVSFDIEKVCIYHQYSNGSNNYHAIPKEIKDRLPAKLKRHLTVAFAEIMEDLKQEKDDCLKKIKAEFEE